ncbi:MAG: hypothetical protein AB1640_19790 [bacterium]
METIEIELTTDAVWAEWWTPEIAPVLCALCGKCPGWESTEKPLECVNGNPWCG